MERNNLPKLELNENGQYIESNTKNRIILRGINLVNKIAPYDYDNLLKPTQKHLSYLSQMGFNLVRLGICWDGVEPKIGIYDDKYLKKITDFINTLSSFGFYTLLDFHQDQYSKATGGWGHPNWSIANKDEIFSVEGEKAVKSFGFPASMFNNLILKEEKGNIISIPNNVSNTFHLFWENKPIQKKGVNDRYIDMVIYTIKKIKKCCNLNSICGIDIINEPWPGIDWLDAYKDEYLKVIKGTKYAKKSVDLSGKIWREEGTSKIDGKLTKFYKKLVSRFVKEINDKSIILYLEPFMMFGSGCSSGINFNEIVKTHNNLQMIFSFHNYTTDSKLVFKNLNKQISLFNKKDNNRLGYLMTEFGADPNPSKWGKDILLESDRLNMDWTYWTYIQNLNYVFTEQIFNNPQYDFRKQAIYYNDNKPFSTLNVNLSIVNALSKPYPMSVSLRENGHYKFKNYTRNNKNTFEIILSNVRNNGTIVVATPFYYFNKNNYTFKIFYANTLNNLTNKPKLLHSGTSNKNKFNFTFKDDIFDENSFVKIVIEGINKSNTRYLILSRQSRRRANHRITKSKRKNNKRRTKRKRNKKQKTRKRNRK